MCWSWIVGAGNFVFHVEMVKLPCIFLSNKERLGLDSALSGMQLIKWLLEKGHLFFSFMLQFHPKDLLGKGIMCQIRLWSILDYQFGVWHAAI